VTLLLRCSFPATVMFGWTMSSWKYAARSGMSSCIGPAMVMRGVKKM